MILNLVKKNLLLLFVFLNFFPQGSSAQNSIKGLIQDSIQAPVSFCAVALVNAGDSSVVKGNLADEKGAYAFKDIKSGSYRLKFANVGFQSFISEIITIDSLAVMEMLPVILKNDGVNLKEVSIAAFKPNIEFKKGMVVMNVENNLLANGNTVLELLRRIPGVTIDAQNNIFVNGQSGVRFLIDGRLQQIPASQMMNLLSGMPAESVSLVELIKNPPAKYDAAGSGGMINIVMKKAKMKGFSGSISESLSRGYHFRSGTTASLNFKSNKVSVFTNFSYYDMHFETNNYLKNSITDSVSKFETISTGRQLPQRATLNLSGGLEYELNKKNILGLTISNNPSKIKNNENARAGITSGNIFNYDHYDFMIETRQQINNPSANINFTSKLDTLGSQIQLSADATNYKENFTKYTENRFFDISDQETQQPGRARTTFDNDFRIYTQKLDYNKQFENTLSFEAGLKSSFVNNLSKAKVELSDTVRGMLETDTNFSNTYKYDERIFAGYISFSKTIKKFSLKAGLRAEQTHIRASTNPKPFRLKRDYINFFPSSSVDYKLNDKHSLQFSYSYRIDRPDYERLNPTRVYNEQLRYGSGNPQLKPQYSHYVELDYNYKNFITLHAGYYRTTGFMYYYFYGVPETKITVDTIFNYPYRNNYIFSVFLQKQIKWLNMQLFGMTMYRNFKGEVNGIRSDSRTLQYYGNFNIEIMLPKEFKLQFNGYYNSKIKDGVQIYYPSGSAGIGILRSFLNKKLDVSLSLYDIFYTERYPYSNSVNGQHSYYSERTDSRRFRAYVLWKFGKMKIDKRTKNSNDEEKGRLKKIE